MYVLLQWSHPSAIMVVYDVTNETSFNSCAKWLERVRSQKPDVPFPGKTSTYDMFFIGV